MTDQTEPVRKSLLPCTPPPEWEFHTVHGARTGTEGCALFPGDTGPVVVRRRVSYGDWEPVRPDRWADEPPTDATGQTEPACRSDQGCDQVVPCDPGCGARDLLAEAVAAGRPAADETERRDRYAKALARTTVGHSAFITVDVKAEYQRADAVMAVADAEQAELRRRIVELESQCRDIDRLRKDWVTMRDRAEALDARVREPATAPPAAVPAGDQTALRDRIAEALLTTHHREHGYHANCVVCAGDVTGLADAVLAVLPDTSRAAAARWAAYFAEEVAEKLRAHHEFERSNGALDVMTELRRVAGGEQPDEVRPRCPHCRLPHDLTPGSMGARACEMVRADIADAERRHAEGDHGRCALVGCGAVRATRTAERAARAQRPDTNPCPPGCIACATDESHDPAPAVSAGPAEPDTEA